MKKLLHILAIALLLATAGMAVGCEEGPDMISGGDREF